MSGKDIYGPEFAAAVDKRMTSWLRENGPKLREGSLDVSSVRGPGSSDLVGPTMNFDQVARWGAPPQFVGSDGEQGSSYPGEPGATGYAGHTGLVRAIKVTCSEDAGGTGDTAEALVALDELELSGYWEGISQNQEVQITITLLQDMPDSKVRLGYTDAVIRKSAPSFMPASPAGSCHTFHFGRLSENSPRDAIVVIQRLDSTEYDEDSAWQITEVRVILFLMANAIQYPPYPAPPEGYRVDTIVGPDE